jgi:hypothetical protein
MSDETTATSTTPVFDPEVAMAKVKKVMKYIRVKNYQARPITPVPGAKINGYLAAVTIGEGEDEFEPETLEMMADYGLIGTAQDDRGIVLLFKLASPKMAGSGGDGVGGGTRKRRTKAEMAEAAKAGGVK